MDSKSDRIRKNKKKAVRNLSLPHQSEAWLGMTVFSYSFLLYLMVSLLLSTKVL